MERLPREGPLDLGGTLAEQRPLLDALMAARPLPSGVRTSRGRLGGVPVVEVLIDGADAVAAYRGLLASGVPHVFQGLAAELDEGAAALDSTGRLPRSHLGAERPDGGRPPQCHQGPERNHHHSAASMT